MRILKPRQKGKASSGQKARLEASAARAQKVARAEAKVRNEVSRRKDGVQRSERKERVRAASRGASRDSSGRQPWADAMRLLAKTVLVLVLGGVITTSVWAAKEFITSASERPINTIAVEGEFVYLSEEEISATVAPMIRNGFLTLPLTEVKRELERNPWIETAAVSRRWPDKLFISIGEQQPIARWGVNGFLNYQGQLVKLSTHPALANLPMLAGNPGQEREMMHNYQQLSQLLRPFGLQIAEFYCDELYSWQIVLTNSLVINIGRDHIMEKVERFLTVYSHSLQEEMDKVLSIDLRYGNGVAVKWRDEPAAAIAAKDNKRTEG